MSNGYRDGHTDVVFLQIIQEAAAEDATITDATAEEEMTEEAAREETVTER